MALWTLAEISTDCWLDASDAANRTIVSGAFSELADKSGNGKDASQTTAAARPTLLTAEQNGLDVARFDGSNDVMALVAVAQASGQHVILAGSTVSLGTSFRKLLASTAGSDLGILFGAGGQNYRPSIFWNGNQRAVQAAAVQKKGVFRWRYAVGAPSSALTQIDGGTETTATFTASALTNWGAIGESGAFPNFDLYELAILPAGTDSDDIDRAIGYLAWKWGTEGDLPPGFPYKDAAPTTGPSGPTIDTQPADTTVLQGETATFTVVATGTGTLLYQWFENGAFMLGENADTLNVTATLLRDGNTYTVRVTDDSDSVTSDPAELTVTPASSIAPVLQGPADVTVQEGQQAVFNVTAYGVGPFTYQWRVGGGAVVPGATSRVLTVPGLPQYDGAYYQVTVTDASGLVTASEYAQLTVTPEPVRGRGTADVDYPCALPGPLVAGNAYRSKSRVRRNDLASGPPIYRLEDDDGYDLFTVAWSFSAGEVQVFRNWFRCDIASGSRLFNIWLMVDGAATRGGRQTVLHSCYFDGVPEYTQRGRRWSVSATLLAIREEAVDCCANLPDLYNGFCGELKRAINAFTDIWPATPPVPTVDLPIECQPYSCSAYEVYAESVGRTFLPAYSPSAAPWAYPFVGDSPVRYRVGTPAPGDAVSDWASGIDPVVPLAWQQVDTAPTFCDGAVLQCIGLGYSGGQSPRGIYPATAQWGSIGLNAIVTGAAGTSRMAGVVLRASDGFTATVNGIGGYQFNPRVNISLSATDLGGGDWEISATIEVFGDDEAPIPPVSTVLGVVGDEWVSFSAYVDMTQPYPSGAGAGIAVDFAAVIRVAGQTLSLSDTITFASGSSTLSYVTARAPGNQSSYFRECSISILAMNLIDTFENLDLDGADLALARNRPDYTPPPSCPAVP